MSRVLFPSSVSATYGCFYVFRKEFVFFVILPRDILCLSAGSITFVSIFSWCASVASGVFVSVCFISFVKSS